MSNRLAKETSPYLLQHKDNPVDWYPWGDEALDEALRRDVPILLSIGYAACHWCHVMERESFEDEATAAVMNEHFVPVKVDREERPDLDAVYMDAVQAMTGHGGWPMTVFLTPEGVPFYGGTYFPPEDRHGMPSFRKLLQAITDTWTQRRDEVETQGHKLIDHINNSQALRLSDDPLTADILERAWAVMQRSYDANNGGFGGAPKFPQPMTIDLLHRLSRRGHERALEMATHTLDRMAAGGMYDQLAGGFARYSVDATWTVPHFEKMLYDNALMLRTYARSWQLTSSQRHREVAIDTARWMLTEMRDAGGGFWSSIDADSEGEEGKFYVWSLDEVRAAAGDDFDAAVQRWGFTEQGNFEGRNIPVLAGEGDSAAVARAREALLNARSKRTRPGTDDKVLTAWNALAASALVESGAILNEPEWVMAGHEAMSFIASQMKVDGRLMRSHRAGVTKHLGFAEDYAFYLEASLVLFEVTGSKRWLGEATWAADEALRLFHDGDRGGFFTTGDDAERLIARNKDLFDNAIPAANSVLALELQRLALLTGEERYAAAGTEVLRLLRNAVEQAPLGFGHLAAALDFHTGEALEIVIVGPSGHPDTADLLRTALDHYLPNRVIVMSPTPDATVSPLLEARTQIDGRATAYVCRRMVCKQPVTSAEDLAAQLAS